MDDLLHELHMIEHLMNEGQMDQALKKLEELSKQHPDNYSVISLLGEAYLYSDKPEKAIKPLLWSSKAFPSEEMIEDEEGPEENLPESTDPEMTATRRLKKIFESHENNPWYDHFLLGCAYGRTMKLRRAIKHLQVADRLSPNNTEVLRNLGWIHCMLGSTETGRNLLQKAIELDPLNALAYNDVGASLMFEGEVEEAKAWISKALQIDPADQFIRNTAEKLEEMMILQTLFPRR